MKPTQSYRIWFSPRTGSTLLCKGLEETGIAGKPGEFFTLFDFNSLSEKYKVHSYSELKEQIWTEGTSSNGVFGMKLTNDEQVFNEINQLRIDDGLMDNTEHVFMDDLFPESKDIFLTRRNKVRQAVSWWKAIKDNEWHLESGQEKKPKSNTFYEDNYNYEALKHLFKESVLHECSIQEYFIKHKINPLTIVYEDLILDYKNTIKNIIAYIGLENAKLDPKEMYYSKTADSDSEKWVQKFRLEFQKELGKKVW